MLVIAPQWQTTVLACNPRMWARTRRFPWAAMRGSVNSTMRCGPNMLDECAAS
jgi:hypothetical protein